MASPTPHHVPLSRALDQSDSLADLLCRFRESEARLAAVQACLPELLRAAVKAGPLDKDNWTLLVGNASTAAKLRQLVPALEASLKDAGWAARALRVKIMSAR
jgi:hypothetical protein